MTTWSPSSWRSFPIKQVPAYADPEALAAVEKRLSTFPPLVFAGDRLAINFSTRDAGSVRVELQSVDGKPLEARDKVMAGAAFVVVGNFFQSENSSDLLEEFAQAIHIVEKSEVKIER